MTPLYHDGIPTTSGIYRITCIVTGKCYIGSAKNLRKRKRDHFSYLQRNTHHNPHLQNAWNKYGEQSFAFEVLEQVLPIALTAREQYWLNKLKPFSPKGFNIAREAGSTLGVQRSLEAIENHRQSLTGYKHTEEARRNMAESRRGTKRGPITREKMRLSALAHAPTKVRDFIVTSPDGIEYEVQNLAQFCREHHLNYSHLLDVARGQYRQAKGWKARYS